MSLYFEIISERKKGVLPAVARAALVTLSVPYARLLASRNWYYDYLANATWLDRPCISIGNITTGGTGKTPVVAWLVETFKWSRHKASLVSGLCAWFFGIGSALSFNHWADLKLMGRTFFDWCEFLSTTVMLPAGGLLVAVFVGWRMSRSSTLDELGLHDAVVYSTWRVLVRFIAPLGVIAIFMNAVGIFG